MSRWRYKSLVEMAQRIGQLGLQDCPVCSSGQMGVERMPVVLSIGQVYREPEKRPADDPEHNVKFMLQITCGVCGYSMLFDSEQFHHGDEEILVKGWTPQEEAAWEAGQGGESS